VTAVQGSGDGWWPAPPSTRFTVWRLIDHVARFIVNADHSIM